MANSLGTHSKEFVLKIYKPITMNRVYEPVFQRVTKVSKPSLGRKQMLNKGMKTSGKHIGVKEEKVIQPGRKTVFTLKFGE